MIKTVDKKRKNVYLSKDDLKLLKMLADEDTGGNESLQVSRLIQKQARLKRVSLEVEQAS